jgi:hypothetical protein
MKPLTEQQIREVYTKDAYSTKRAVTGQSIIYSNERMRNHTNILADVLADLIHYAAREGVDFDDCLQEAKLTFWRNTGITYED